MAISLIAILSLFVSQIRLLGCFHNFNSNHFSLRVFKSICAIIQGDSEVYSDVAVDVQGDVGDLKVRVDFWMLVTEFQYW